jgi:hypothetical protein
MITEEFAGNPPYSNLPPLPDGTGIRPVRIESKPGGVLAGSSHESNTPRQIEHIGRGFFCRQAILLFVNILFKHCLVLTQKP